MFSFASVDGWDVSTTDLEEGAGMPVVYSFLHHSDNVTRELSSCTLAEGKI